MAGRRKDKRSSRVVLYAGRISIVDVGFTWLLVLLFSTTTWTAVAAADVSPLAASPIIFSLEFAPPSSSSSPFVMSTTTSSSGGPSSIPRVDGAVVQQTLDLSNAAWNVMYQVNISSTLVQTFVSASLFSTAVDVFQAYTEEPVVSSASPLKSGASSSSSSSSTSLVLDDVDGNPWGLRTNHGRWTLGFDKSSSRVVLNLSSVPEHVYYSVTEYKFTKPGVMGNDALCTHPQASGYKCCQLTASTYGLFTLVSATEPVTCTSATISSVDIQVMFGLSVAVGPALAAVLISLDKQIGNGTSAGFATRLTATSIPQVVHANLPFAVCRNGGSIGSLQSAGSLFYCPQWLFGPSPRQVGYNDSSYVNDRSCNGAPLGYYTSPVGGVNAEQFSSFRQTQLSFFLSLPVSCQWDGTTSEHTALDSTSGNVVTYLDSIGMDCNESGTFSITLSAYIPSAALFPLFNVATIDAFTFDGWTVSPQPSLALIVVSVSLRALLPQVSRRPGLGLLSVTLNVSCSVGLVVRPQLSSGLGFLNVSRSVVQLNLTQSLAPKKVSFLLTNSSSWTSMMNTMVACTASIQQLGINTSRIYLHTSTVSSRQTLLFAPSSRPMPTASSNPSQGAGGAKPSVWLIDSNLDLLQDHVVGGPPLGGGVQCMGDLAASSAFDGSCRPLDDAGCIVKYGPGWRIIASPSTNGGGVCRPYSLPNLAALAHPQDIVALAGYMWQRMKESVTGPGTSPSTVPSPPTAVPPDDGGAAHELLPWIALPLQQATAPSTALNFLQAYRPGIIVAQVSSPTDASLGPIVDNSVSGAGIGAIVILVLLPLAAIALVSIWSDCVNQRFVPFLQKIPLHLRRLSLMISSACWSFFVWCAVRCTACQRGGEEEEEKKESAAFAEKPQSTQEDKTRNRKKATSRRGAEDSYSRHEGRRWTTDDNATEVRSGQSDASSLVAARQGDLNAKDENNRDAPHVATSTTFPMVVTPLRSSQGEWQDDGSPLPTVPRRLDQDLRPHHRHQKKNTTSIRGSVADNAEDASDSERKQAGQNPASLNLTDRSPAEHASKRPPAAASGESSAFSRPRPPLEQHKLGTPSHHSLVGGSRSVDMSPDKSPQATLTGSLPRSTRLKNPAEPRAKNLTTGKSPLHISSNEEELIAMSSTRPANTSSLKERETCQFDERRLENGGMRATAPPLSPPSTQDDNASGKLSTKKKKASHHRRESPVSSPHLPSSPTPPPRTEATASCASTASGPTRSPRRRESGQSEQGLFNLG